jgi:hypothetical protein
MQQRNNIPIFILHRIPAEVPSASSFLLGGATRCDLRRPDDVLWRQSMSVERSVRRTGEVPALQRHLPAMSSWLRHAGSTSPRDTQAGCSNQRNLHCALESAHIKVNDRIALSTSLRCSSTRLGMMGKFRREAMIAAEPQL